MKIDRFTDSSDMSDSYRVSFFIENKYFKHKFILQHPTFIKLLREQVGDSFSIQLSGDGIVLSFDTKNIDSDELINKEIKLNNESNEVIKFITRHEEMFDFVTDIKRREYLERFPIIPSTKNGKKKK